MNRRSPDTRLRVAVLAHLRHPIRAPFAGGVEAHTWHLARGLAARGHTVTLYASGDSATGVALFPVVDEHYERRLPWADHHEGDVLRRHLDAAYERAWDAIEAGDHDVVHNNTLHPLPIERARARGVPMLTALHVPPFARLAHAVAGPAVPQLHFCVTSRRQDAVWRGVGRRDDPTGGDGRLDGTDHDDSRRDGVRRPATRAPRHPPVEPHVVANGIDPDVWPFRAAGDGSAIWAGRITPTKGTHLAIDAARRAGIALSIVGKIEDRSYFERQVAPGLSDTIRHLGHVEGDALAKLFGRASVLLFTPRWEEPFGLVAIEAMACGLPVAYVDRGAAREVVGEAGSGSEGEDGGALAAAIERALDVPREVPRRRVESRFTLDGMLDGYERLYHDCIDGVESARTGSVAVERPSLRADRSAATCPAPEARVVCP